MTKMILVRHCQAEGNLKRFFQGRIDTDITELGAQQIERTAAFLADEPIDIIYVSSKKRAQKTAEGINRFHNVPMKVDDRIVEINAGDWEGVVLTEIQQHYPEAFDNWKNHPAVFQAPNGENMAEVYARVSEALMDIARENAGKTICVVSHGCAIRNMMCFLHGWPVDKIGAIPLGTNTTVNMISFDEQLRPAILLENYTDHLAGLPSTREPFK